MLQEAPELPLGHRVRGQRHRRLRRLGIALLVELRHAVGVQQAEVRVVLPRMASSEVLVGVRVGRATLAGD